MFGIGELSRRTGLRASALRYYEDLGLLAPAGRRHGRRYYDAAALDRVAFIQFARACGFRLDEIAILVRAGTASRARLGARWKPLATSKLGEMDALIARAEAMKRFLAIALACECAGVDECGRLVRASAPDRPAAG